MRGSTQDIPVAVDVMGVLIRQVEWGAMNAAIETFAAGTDTEPVFKGLPGDRCQCEHWGYVVRGRFRVRYQDHDEVLSAGDLYYLSPGHLPLFEEETTVVEFSPLGAYQQTLEVAGANIAKMLEVAPHA